MNQAKIKDRFPNEKTLIEAIDFQFANYNTQMQKRLSPLIDRYEEARQLHQRNLKYTGIGVLGIIMFTPLIYILLELALKFSIISLISSVLTAALILWVVSFFTVTHEDHRVLRRKINDMIDREAYKFAWHLFGITAAQGANANDHIPNRTSNLARNPGELN
jgi:hypothetical protein